MAGGKAIILPLLSMENRVHSLVGLSALKLQGIDNKIVVFVMEEKLPKSDRSITYSLILNLAKLSLDLCASLTEKGYLFLPEDKAVWTPKHIQEQWDQVDKAKNDSAPVVQGAVQTNIEPIPPKKRATKWKFAVGPSRQEAVEVEAKLERGKADELLSLQ